MAHFAARQMKIRILCDRAEKEEIEKEKLEDQGLTEKEIEDTLKMRKTQTFQSTGKTLPFLEKEEVIKTLHATNLGLPGTHLVKSATKDMYEDMERKVAKQKAKKLAATMAKPDTIKLEGTLDGNTGKATVELGEKEKEKLALRQKKLKSAKEQDEHIKKQNFRDHLNEMSQGMEAMSKNKASHYGEQFVFTKDMQEECDTQNFDHHLKKNDLKWYSEAYVKYKGTMRK